MASIVKKVLDSVWSIPNYDYSGVVKAYLKKVVGLKNVPKDIVKFYSQTNGFIVKFENEIFSLETISDILQNKYEYADFNEFISDMNLEEEMEMYKLVPIADDGMGGYYVFKSNVKDDKIYYLDHEFPSSLDKCQTYDNFNSYLAELKDMQDEIVSENSDDY